MLIHDYITSPKVPNKSALVCSNSVLTYGQLDEASRSLAGHLVANGLHRGDRVAVFLENSPHLIISMFGTFMAGGCAVPIDAEVPTDRLRFLLENCGARFLVIPASKVLTVLGLADKLTPLPQIIWVGPAPTERPGATFDEAIASNNEVKLPTVVDLDVSLIMYTSGSTGKPKGVTHTHRSVDTAVEAINSYFKNTEKDVLLGLHPLHWTYGLLQVLEALRCGGCAVVERGQPSAHDMIRTIGEQGVTGVAGTPTIWANLLSAGLADNSPLTTLRYVANSADALPASYVPRLRNMLPGRDIFLMYGLTECFRASYLPPQDLREHPTSIGKGMQGVEMWLEDDDGRTLSAGGVGELVMRGSNVMVGYWNDPEGTSKVLLPGRYPWERVLHTGDLFKLDGEGYFHFISRKDDIIKCRGQKVSPVEIESVLYQLDEIAECRVVGVEDEMQGQMLRAEVVLKPGKEFNTKKFRGHCGMLLEAYKVPGEMIQVEQIPRAVGGKVKRG